MAVQDRPVVGIFGILNEAGLGRIAVDFPVEIPRAFATRRCIVDFFVSPCVSILASRFP